MGQLYSGKIKDYAESEAGPLSAGCVDSVLWHEYAHLIVPNHSQRFYSVILHHMPDYEVRKALLNGDL